MMAIKGFDLRKLINGQNVIILVIALTIIYYIFKPQDFFQNYRSFETQYRQIKEAELFYFNPGKPNEVLIVQQDNLDSYFSLYFYNIGTNELMQRDINNAFIKNNYKMISSLYVPFQFILSVL